MRRLLDEHCAYQFDHQNRLWAALMLELWFRTWIDAIEAPTDTAVLHAMV
jgi:hypothetical protein